MMQQFAQELGFAPTHEAVQTLALFGAQSVCYVENWLPVDEGGACPHTVCHGDLCVDN